MNDIQIKDLYRILKIDDNKKEINNKINTGSLSKKLDSGFKVNYKEKQILNCNNTIVLK